MPQSFLELSDTSRTSSPEGHGEGGQCGHLQPEGTVAAQLVERAASSLHQQALQGSWAVFHGDTGGRLIRRTAVVRTRMPGGVGGVASRGAPLSRLTAPARRCRRKTSGRKRPDKSTTPPAGRTGSRLFERGGGSDQAPGGLTGGGAVAIYDAVQKILASIAVVAENQDSESVGERTAAPRA